MTKKEYMKPSVKVVELQQQCQILAGSVDAYNMNTSVQEEEVDEGFSREFELDEEEEEL